MPPHVSPLWMVVLLPDSYGARDPTAKTPVRAREVSNSPFRVTCQPFACPPCGLPIVSGRFARRRARLRFAHPGARPPRSRSRGRRADVRDRRARDDVQCTVAPPGRGRCTGLRRTTVPSPCTGQGDAGERIADAHPPRPRVALRRVHRSVHARGDRPVSRDAVGERDGRSRLDRSMEASMPPTFGDGPVPGELTQGGRAAARTALPSASRPTGRPAGRRR